MIGTYLRAGLPSPQPTALDAPFWEGLRQGRLLLQRCRACERFQWAPEWICHRCLSFDLGYAEVEARGMIYSHERVWHPVHPALADNGPYVVVLVELLQADGARIVGNLLGDPMQPLVIGAHIEGVFEHHTEHEPPFSLLQWRMADKAGGSQVRLA
ncbi:MAG TPA: zinc ribbon domain-containing protein [Burkholderiales bacterium]|nr:zinc ribbon domain-containing protein [Burkholderiales bacterium]